jgi:hypothetical protein
MPYKREGNTVFVKRGKRWVKKAEAKSAKNAESMIRLLYMKEREQKNCGGVMIVLGKLQSRKKKNGKKKK